MDYRALGRTGVKVSRLCLGTMTFGEQNSEAEGHAQLDYALGQPQDFSDFTRLQLCGEVANEQPDGE